MSGARPALAVLTRERDLHAYAVAHALRERRIPCSIIETDRLAVTGGMSWSMGGQPATGVIHDVDGAEVPLADLDAIWWRRLTGSPKLPDDLQDEAARDLVERDCRATLFGLVLTEFSGAWISHPEATRLAENKLVQLRAARQVGLRVPPTLVSQNPERVRQFCESLDYRVVVKPVAGTPQAPAMTGRVTPDLVASDQALALSPAIYQELVPGTRHLRVCCFGDEIHTALIESDRLDWRYPLDASAEPYRLERGLADQLRALLRTLNIRMGVADMKLDPAGEPIWLEINPQGQFLFLQGLCGMPLTDVCADFLLREASGR